MRRALAAAIGAATAAWIIGPGPPGVAVWLAVAASALAGIAWLAVRRTDGPIVAAISALAIALRLLVAPGPTTEPVALPGSDGPWHATIESISSPREGLQPATVRLAVHDLRIAATLPRFPAVEPGQPLELTGRLEPPPEGPYGDYLRRIGVAGIMRARTMAVEGSVGSPAMLERLRREAAASLARAIPEPEAGLAAGILVGLRDRVDRDLAGDFTTAGASHIVAISGWNIAIVAASIGALGGRLARRRRALLTAVAIGVYVVFVGASPSVLRAAAMAGVVLLARESGRSGRAAAALGWAAAILLLADPALIRDAGFQLSTVATGGLIAWATPLSDRIGRLAGGRLPGWLVEGLGVSLAAQAATLPIVLASFGRLSVVAPVVNLAVVPLVTPAMAAGGVALLAGGAAVVPGAPDGVATILGLPAWGLLAVIVGIVRFFAGLPFASVTLEPPADGATAVLVAVVVAVVGTQRGRSALARLADRRRIARHPPTVQPGKGGRATGGRSRVARAAATTLAMAVGGAGLVIIHRPDGATTLVVLDVGQGDAILVEGSRGGRLLVDGGPDPDRLLVALDERLPPWDRRIDALVLSHPHEDHVAGLALLLERYRIGRVFEPGMRGPGPGYAAWLAGIAATGMPVGRLATGSRLAVDDARLTVLWPDPGSVAGEPPDSGTGINNVSVVLFGEAAGRRFLLTGDIEEEIDPTLVARGPPPVDVLKVAHHGSGTASTARFLDAVDPSIAVVSAGADNRYGHPNRGTLDRLAERGARVLRTDTDGTVEIALDAGPVRVRTAGARASAAPARTASAGTGRPRLFSCAIPIAALKRPEARPPAPPVARYEPWDDRPRAHSRGRRAPEARSAALAPPACGPGTSLRGRWRRALPRGPARRPPVSIAASRRAGAPPPRSARSGQPSRSGSRDPRPP